VATGHTGQAERLLLQLFHGFDSHRGQANCGHTQSKITNIIYSCYRISDMHERRLSFRLVPDYIWRFSLEEISTNMFLYILVLRIRHIPYYQISFESYFSRWHKCLWSEILSYFLLHHLKVC
jgi:hypothetical protein